MIFNYQNRHFLKFILVQFAPPHRHSNCGILHSPPQIQESFKASLLRKNPEYYEKMWSCDEDYMKNGYIWIHKLSKDQIEQMKKGIDLPLIDICEKFGSGTPAQYRISRELCQKWILRKHMNPETWRTIKESGTIYKDYEKASKFYGLI